MPDPLALGYRLILLFLAADSPTLPGGPFCLSIPHQDRLETPLPEVHPPGDPCPVLPGPADTQRLCKNDVIKEEGLIGIPTPSKRPPPLCCQYGREAAPYCARGSGVPAF